MDSQQLDRVFSALSDATRRDILSALAQGERNVGQLTSSFAISQPAISRHLRLLQEAELITRDRRGRETFARIKEDTADQAADWIKQQVQFWQLHFDEMDKILASKEQKNGT